MDDIFVVVLCGGAEHRLAVVFIPVAQPVSEQHIRLNFSVISPHHAFGELTQLLLTFPLCFGENILCLGKAAVIIADDNAALPPAVAALSYGASSAFPFLCQGLSPFPLGAVQPYSRILDLPDTSIAALSSVAGRQARLFPPPRTESAILRQPLRSYSCTAPIKSSIKPPTMPLAAFCISGVTWV